MRNESMTKNEPLEPSKILQQIDAIEAKKIRFEVNRFELPIGIEGTFGIIRHPGAALAVPILGNGNIIILRQYRFAVSRRVLEFPAGTLEKNEAPIATIQRELQEESGYKAEQWNALGSMLPCPGYSDEIIHLFLARKLKKLEEKLKGDEDEDIDVLEMSKDELEQIISTDNEALDGKTITAWHKAKQFLFD